MGRKEQGARWRERRRQKLDADPALRDAVRARKRAADRIYRARRKKRLAEDDSLRAHVKDLHDRWHAANTERVRLAARLSAARWRANNAERAREISRNSKRRAALRLRDARPMLAIIREAVSIHLSPHVRDDVIMMMVEDVLSGALELRYAKAKASAYVRRYNRENGTYREKSIDATIPGTDGLRIIETIAAEETV